MKIVLALALLGFSLIAQQGCAKRAIRNIDSNGTSIICFGDSVTFGYGASPGEDYPAILAKKTKIPVINAGLDGDTSSEALKRLKSDVLDRDPRLVIIEFGGNDFLRKIPIETTTDNISKMIDQIHSRGAMVAIADISAGLLLRDYHPAVYKLAKKKEAIFIPSLFSGILTNPNLKSDFIHPNSEGYKIIAQRVYKVIMPYLNKNTETQNSP
jgi:acyl-CoA thioesterase-1